MTIGGSLFLFAVGAILRYAVSDSIDGVDLEMVGLILMIVAAVGFLIGLLVLGRGRTAARPVEREEERPPRY